jgi:T5SS/PEP-CTERM-associated repeat protein
LTSRGGLIRRVLLGTTALVALGLILTPSASRAADWTGANSTDWFDPANWSGGVPTNATDAVIDTATPNPAEVDGAPAQAHDIYVGNAGTGALTIQNGGAVSSDIGVVGYNAGSTGTVTVGAGSSWTNTGNLYAGHSGTGTLTIQNGGAASNNIGYIGVAAGAIGTVTVDGTGSSWTNGGVLYAGYSGTGTLTIQNGGTVSNTAGYLGYNAGATGTVTVDGVGSSWTNSGDLFVGNQGTGTLTIQNGGTVSSADLYVGNEGAGTLTIQNGSTVSNAYGLIGYFAGSTGAVTVDGTGSSWTNTGNLSVGLNGTGALTIQNGGAVSNADGFIGHFAGSTGTVTVDGAGSTWTSTGGLYVGNQSTGTLTIRNGAAVSNANGFIGYSAGSTGTVTVDGAGSSWTNAGDLYVGNSGTGTLTIQNGGTVSASNGIIAGTLNIGAASGQAAAAPGTLNTASVAFGAGAGLIVFNHTAANYAFNPVISGAGSVTVEAGTTILSGTNTYTGATTVNGGTLSVNGSIASSVLSTVNSGGTLGGTGTVGATTINAGGALAPGNSIGTLSVQGNLTFNAGGAYTVEVSPTAADRTNVSGTATLTGATVNAIALPGSFTTRTYTIINATGGITGTFAGVTASGTFSPTRPTLSYDANNVYLVLVAGLIELPQTASGNQSSVAGAINRFVESGGTPPAGFDALLNMSAAQQSNALSQVSGQPGASSAQSGSAAPGQFVNAVFGTAFGGGTGGAGALGFAEENAYAPKRKMSREAKEAYAAVTPRDRTTPTFEGRWGVFASVFGGNNRVGGDATSGTNTTTSRTYGMVVGADYRFTRDTQAGFALGGAGSSFSVDGGFGGGKADIFNAAVYARHNIGAAYLAGALSYSWQDTTTDRTVTISGTDQLRASFKAQALTARLEGGWRYTTPLMGITPYASVQSTSFFMPAYGETATSGSSQFALSYAAKTTTNVRTELGARFDKAIVVQGGVFTLSNRTAWAHDSNVDSSASATFQSLPGATFTTHGAQPSAHAALLSLGADMKWHSGWSVAALLDGEFSRTTTGYTGKGTLRYAW